MKAQWIEVWRITYRLRRGEEWSPPLEVNVASGKDGQEAAKRVKDALLAGGNPPDDVRVVSVEHKFSRVALLPGVAWEWKEDTNDRG